MAGNTQDPRSVPSQTAGTQRPSGPKAPTPTESQKVKGQV